MILTNLLRCCMRSHPSSHLCFDDWHEFSYVNFFISYCSSLFTSFFDFYCFETVFSSNSKDTGKTRENNWGCGNLTNFLQRKIKRCQWRVSNFERSSSWQTDFFADIYCIFTSRKPLYFGIFEENRTEYFFTMIVASPLKWSID